MGANVLPLEERLKLIKCQIRKELLKRGIKPFIETCPHYLNLNVKGYGVVVSPYSKQNAIRAAVFDEPGRTDPVIDSLREALEACNIEVYLFSESCRDFI